MKYVHMSFLMLCIVGTGTQAMHRKPQPVVHSGKPFWPNGKPAAKTVTKAPQAPIMIPQAPAPTPVAQARKVALAPQIAPQAPAPTPVAQVCRVTQAPQMAPQAPVPMPIAQVQRITQAPQMAPQAPVVAAEALARVVIFRRIVTPEPTIAPQATLQYPEQTPIMTMADDQFQEETEDASLGSVEDQDQFDMGLTEEEQLLIALDLSQNEAQPEKPQPASSSSPVRTERPVAPVVVPAVADVEFECPVCMDNKKDADCCTLACGHKYCKDCLKHVLDGALAAHSTATLHCPTPNCRPIDIADIAKITQDKAKLEQLDAVQLEEFLHINSGKHCPTPNCPYSFIDEDRVQQTIICPCCHQHYCSECLTHHSERITCAEALENKQLGGDHAAAEKATQDLIQKDSKACPKCGVRIYRSAGCNHMTCRCGYEFCWLCMIEWPGYNRHACPTFGEVGTY